MSIKIFANDPEYLGSIPGRALPKILTLVLDISLLNTQQYKVQCYVKLQYVCMSIRIFANDLGYLGSIPGRVIPKILTLVLDISLLNTQQYKVQCYVKLQYVCMSIKIFANDPGYLDSIPGRVIPKILTLVLDISLLKTQQYKVQCYVKLQYVCMSIRIFANDLGYLGSIPGRVIPKILTLGLDISLLKTQQYKVQCYVKLQYVCMSIKIFANDPGYLGSIPGRVIPKILTLGLDISLLNTQQYKVQCYVKLQYVCMSIKIFANDPGYLGSIPGRALPKILTLGLDISLLNTQQYKVQ